MRATRSSWGLAKPMRWPTNETVVPASAKDSLLSLKFLTALLSLTAGSLDAITFLGLGGLFTAHITGNLVVLAAHFSTGVPARPASMLAVPVFILILGATRVFARGLEAMGYTSLRPLLLLQFLFLLALTGAGTKTTEIMLTVSGMLGVSAMAVQNALVQLSLTGAPSTAVMTTNTVRFTIDVCAMLLPTDPNAVAEARERASKTWPSMVGFTIGCMLGALCEARFGLRSLALPTALSALALLKAMTSASK